LVKFPSGTQFGASPSAAVVEMAVRCEESGADGVVLGEHVVMGPAPEAYSWGDFPFPVDAPFPEPMVVLSAVAAVTHRVVLTTGVLVAALRPAPLLAKQAATLDELSGGRLELGVGTGWQREELEALGVPFERRGPSLTETIGACRALWGDQPARFDSPTVSFDGLWCVPRPRPGRPPVHFSGTLNDRNVRRVVELGDGWIPIMGATGEAVAADAARLREAWAEAGRGPDPPHVRMALPLRKLDGRLSVGATVAGWETVAAMGGTDLTLPMAAFVRDEGHLGRFVDDLGEARSRLPW
jgi:probable F420-dependent oxidoreductase